MWSEPVGLFSPARLVCAEDPERKQKSSEEGNSVPTYVFACETCREEFTVRTSWGEKEGVRCPACGGAELKEMFGRYTFAAIGGDGGELPVAEGGCACGASEPGACRF